MSARTTSGAARPAPAIDGTPPVSPNLVREVPGERAVGRNTVETLLFRGLSTPIALLLVVVQSRFLEPAGRGKFVLVVLSVTIVSRLLGQLGLAVTTRTRTHHAGLRSLIHRAFALGFVLGLGGAGFVVLTGAATDAIGTELALIAAAALIPNVLWQTLSGVLLGLARVRVWNYVQALSPLLTLVGMLVLVVGSGAASEQRSSPGPSRTASRQRSRSSSRATSGCRSGPHRSGTGTAGRSCGSRS